MRSYLINNIQDFERRMWRRVQVARVESFHVIVPEASADEMLGVLPCVVCCNLSQTEPGYSGNVSLA
jgi:hypothetical protein